MPGNRRHESRRCQPCIRPQPGRYAASERECRHTGGTIAVSGTKEIASEAGDDQEATGRLSRMHALFKSRLSICKIFHPSKPASPPQLRMYISTAHASSCRNPKVPLKKHINRGKLNDVAHMLSHAPQPTSTAATLGDLHFTMEKYCHCASHNLPKR